MNGFSGLASVGASVDAVRVSPRDTSARLTEQKPEAPPTGEAVLVLIQQALALPDTTGRDLDVLA